MADTISLRFLQTRLRASEKTAVSYSQNGQWVQITWNEYYALVESLAIKISESGVVRGTKIGIFADTCFQWSLIDLAALSLGAITVPLYHNIPIEDLIFILNETECEFLFVQNQALHLKIESIRDRLVFIKKVYLMSGENEGTENPFKISSDKSQREEHSFLEKHIKSLATDDTATIVYTSGTMGAPKGVVLSHSQILSEVTDAFPLLGITASDTTLSVLPFAHIMGRIEIWGHALIGYHMAYAESLERYRRNLQEIRPTVIMAVPRIFEKIQWALSTHMQSNPVQKKLFDWAQKLGSEVAKHRSNKTSPPFHLVTQFQLANQLILQKVRENLGGRLRFAVCGGAPLNPSVAQFFASLDILLLEGYGLTETTGAIFVNTPFDYRFGSVGKSIGDVQIRFDEFGEILVKSAKVMQGYYKVAHDDETTPPFTEDGFFHTGDIGHLDDKGFLVLTDRKKNLIKTSGGKYVAPLKLENRLKENSLISHAYIHGERQKFITALLSLDTGELKRWAKTQGLAHRSVPELLDSTELRQVLKAHLIEVNQRLASFETIKNFAVAPVSFSIEGGELTPSLKIKSSVIKEKYGTTLQELYL